MEDVQRDDTGDVAHEARAALRHIGDQDRRNLALLHPKPLLAACAEAPFMDAHTASLLEIFLHRRTLTAVSYVEEPHALTAFGPATGVGFSEGGGRVNPGKRGGLHRVEANKRLETTAFQQESLRDTAVVDVHELTRCYESEASSFLHKLKGFEEEVDIETGPPA